MVQRQKEKEFIELKISSNMTVMQYANKFIELSRFVPKFISSERLKISNFEEGLALYVRNQLAGQPILTYQELCEGAAEVDQGKTELRGHEPNQLKEKGV